MGDVHVWLGRLGPEDYTSPTPDGRPATREYAGERLARAVCADREMLDEHAITASRSPLPRRSAISSRAHCAGSEARIPVIDTAVVAGLGEFIGREAAECAGFKVGFAGGPDRLCGHYRTRICRREPAPREPDVAVVMNPSLGLLGDQDRWRACRGYLARWSGCARHFGAVAAASNRCWCRGAASLPMRSGYSSARSASLPLPPTGWRFWRWISTPMCSPIGSPEE